MKKVSNHIEEYFTKIEGSRDLITAREIFKADKENIDIKTDISHQEIVLLNALLYNNIILKSKGLKPVWMPFINQYMRLKISLDRKSRGEFVDVNRSGDPSKMLQDFSNIKSLEKDKR